MSWTAGDTHFLVSDNQYHLASGAHFHGGAAQPNKRSEVQKTQAQIEDETLLMAFVEDYLNKII